MTDGAIELVSTAKTFGGHLLKFRHQSQACQCAMQFNVFQSPSVNDAGKAIPVHCIKSFAMQTARAIHWFMGRW